MTEQKALTGDMARNAGLVPYREKNFGRDRDKIRILGDIIELIGIT